MSNLIDLEISISSVHILQRAGIWDLEDITSLMQTHPATASLALAKIRKEDFDIIAISLKKTK